MVGICVSSEKSVQENEEMPEAPETSGSWPTRRAGPGESRGGKRQTDELWGRIYEAVDERVRAGPYQAVSTGPSTRETLNLDRRPGGRGPGDGRGGRGRPHGEARRGGGLMTSATTNCVLRRGLSGGIQQVFSRALRPFELDPRPQRGGMECP